MTDTKTVQTFGAKLLCAFYRKVTGRTDAENGAIWFWHYFVYRSKWRAYLHTLMPKSYGRAS